MTEQWNNNLLTIVLDAALSRGGDFADLYYQNKSYDYIQFEDGKVNQAYTKIEKGVGIRVLKGDQTGFAVTEDFSPQGLKRAAETAAAIASGSSRSCQKSFQSPAFKKLYADTPQWTGYPAENKISLVQELGEKILSADSSIIKAGVFLQASDEDILIANSEGLIVEEKRPYTSIFCSCRAEKQGRIEGGYSSRASRCGPELYTQELKQSLVKTAVDNTMFLFDASVPPAGEMPLVLGPGISGIFLHEAMGHGFEADFNRKDISIFSRKMNQKVAADFVNIVDSGIVPNNGGSLQVDDEGTPTEETRLVEKGKLVSYLHDRISATHYGVKPTGNGRRESYRFMPVPRMRVTFMENGPHDPQEIISSVKKGIYAMDFQNGQVDIGGGDFSFFVSRGYLIENGKLTMPIKDANLIGNGPDCLGKITMAGNDFEIASSGGNCGKAGQSVPVGFGQPSLKISSVNVGGVNK